MNQWERQRAAMEQEREWREKLTEGDAVMVYFHGSFGRSISSSPVRKRTPKRVIVGGRTFALAAGSWVGRSHNGDSVEIWQPDGPRFALFREQQAKEEAEAQEEKECRVLRRRIEAHLQGLGLDELLAAAAMHGLDDQGKT